MVNVLPVPALASIRRLPCNGKSSGSRATGICCWLMPAPPRHAPGQPAAARRAARPSARTHRWRAAGRSPDRPEPAPARRPPRPHAEPSLVALARLAHGFLGLCGATTGEPGESGPAGQRQRLAHALAPGVDQLVEVLAGALARQRRNLQGAGLAHQHAAHRLAETLQGEVLQPVAYQAVPLEAAPLMELAAEQLQARQAPGSVATQAAEPVLQLQPGRMAMAQLLLLLDRLRPALDFLAVAPEQVGQRLQQMARGELAERRQRQATLSPQSLDLGLQLHRQALGIPVSLDPALHAFGQLELQLPVVQRVQFERLFVVAGQLLVVEAHLEPLLEERIHRVGEELRQRSQPQRALQLQRRQGRFGVGSADLVLAMDLAPLAGVGEQAIDALLRRIVKIPAAERLQRMLLGQGTQQRPRRRRPSPGASRPPGDRATGRSAPRAAARHCRGYSAPPNSRRVARAPRAAPRAAGSGRPRAASGRRGGSRCASGRNPAATAGGGSRHRSCQAGRPAGTGSRASASTCRNSPRQPGSAGSGRPGPGRRARPRVSR